MAARARRSARLAAVDALTERHHFSCRAFRNGKTAHCGRTGVWMRAAVGSLPVPEGATREMVALGERIYRGQAGGAACTGCHGESGEGTPLGPDLTGKKWLWSDGSYAGIAKTITEGVLQPKQYRAPMPPMGGAQLTPDQISALAAYVWGLSHRAPPNPN